MKPLIPEGTEHLRLLWAQQGNSWSWCQGFQKCLELRDLHGASLVAQMVESACSAGDLGSILGLGRSPGEGNGNPVQYSCFENYMDGGAWQATVHGGHKESDTT